MRKILFAAALCLFAVSAVAQENTNTNPFRQLGTMLPTPNEYRTASGAPGHAYWQQRADYKIDVRLDEDEQMVYGEETIDYFNRSPDSLPYLWLQLDQNMRAKDSDANSIEQSKIDERMTFENFRDLVPWFEGGFQIEYVRDTRGNDLPYTINGTMMRVDLPSAVVPNGGTTLKIKWHYRINDRMKVGGRSGYEFFEDENNAIYTIAQFYPRMVVYDDYNGWQHKQFLGNGEFTLTFGNFDVRITVPADHILGATGELQNAKDVLTPEQRDRLQRAKTSDTPVEVVTEAEALDNEKGRAKGMKTWYFKAENVRDFAWATSRKFIWDAQGVPIGDRTVMAMSLYPPEANPLWGQYSTATVIHTLKSYGKYTFDYPYPVAISVNAASIGMEYPMICFNYGRTESDGTYSAQMKYGVISVIIHEVGHNWFPMIVNSDERQWTWMDESLNTFLQYLAEQSFEEGFPSRRGEARQIVDYMKGDQSKMTPTMTNSESIYQFGNNAYGKPTTALNILRETVMGRELFDFAFKTYANRWKFKTPTPADFFRTMEDASGVDLDWFWRGWFFTTNHVDLSIENVKYYRLVEDQAGSMKLAQAQAQSQEPPSISEIRRQRDSVKTVVELNPALEDFYTNNRAPKPDQLDEVEYETWKQSLTDEERAALKDKRNFYEVTFGNHGMVMPVIVGFYFDDGSQEVVRIPAEIWKMDDKEVSKVFAFDKKVQKIVLDPYLETADIDVNNNTWTVSQSPARFELTKKQKRESTNAMQRAKKTE